MARLDLDSLIPFLDSLKEVVWFREPSGRYLFINRVFEEIYGVPVSKLQEDPRAWQENVAEEDRDAVREAARKAVLEPVHLTWSRRDPDGAERRLRTHMRPLHMPDGSPAGVVGMTEDLTESLMLARLSERVERVRVERDAARGEGEMLREILDRITDGFFALDRDWVLLYVNRRFEEIMGVRSRDVVGRDSLEMFPEVEHTIFQEGLIRAMREGRTVETEAHWPPLGKVFAMRAYPSHAGLSVFFQDVTEQRRSERELERREERYRSLTEDVIDSSPIGTVVVDADGLIVWASRTFREFFGIDRARARGRRWVDVVDEHLLPTFRHPEVMRRHLIGPPRAERGAPGQEEPLILVERDGRKVWLSHGATRIRTGLYAGGRIDQFTDLTEKHRLETELVRIASAEQRRIGGELHDNVGQKMTGATFMLEALTERLKAGETIEPGDVASVRDILLEATTATRRISRGLFPIELDDQSLVEAIDQLARDVEEMFDVRCTTDAPGPVRLDTESCLHLLRIVQELATNAVKHGGATRISIRLREIDRAAEAALCHDGSLAPPLGTREGLGMRLIRHRATLIGASLETTTGEDGLICTSCRLPRETLG